MSIREIRKEDFENYKSLIDSDVDIDYFNYFLNNVLTDKHKIFVLELDNILIGTGTILIEEKLTYGGSKLGHIENIFIEKKQRGNGYGEFIVKKLLNICKEKKCYRVDLNCIKELDNFYKKNNFKQNCISMNVYFKENFK